MSTQNIYALTDTWNAGGTTFTAIKMDVLDTASAAGSLLMDLQVGGSSRFNVRKDGVVQTLNVYATGSLGYALFNDNGLSLNSSARIGFTATGSAQNAQDLQLWRDAADTLAQRNGTNAQTFRVYGSFTDASNYQRLAIDQSAIFTQAAGSGTLQSLSLGTSIGARVVFGTNGSIALYGASVANIWNFNTSGHFLAAADNTYDIGASGANRPRNLFVGSDTYTTGLFVRTGSAPAAGGSTSAVVRLSSTAGFGVFWGSGAPTISAAKGALYLRTDGSGTNDRMYVNTDGATTWTAVTTVG